ncbi:hypothetical protein [Okeania sp. SIO2C9]|nr:hypothetical protein [Okeania sp. SIO2C9]
MVSRINFLKKEEGKRKKEEGRRKEGFSYLGGKEKSGVLEVLSF